MDGVESVMPECGRHNYPLLLQDEAVLNGEFLAEVSVVMECLRAFLSGCGPSFMYYVAEFA